MITKKEMEGRAKSGKRHDGGKAKLGERTHMYVCSTHRDRCTGKFSSKINDQAHGSYDDAIRCMRRAARANELNA